MTGARAPFRGSAGMQHPAGALPGGFTGLSRRRRGAGATLLGAGLLVLALAHGPARQLDYAVPVLLVFTLVVAAALLGGMQIALPGAVAGALLLNWFLTPPYGTLVIESAEQVLVLAVYLGVAVAVSWVVDLAARRTAEAARARAEAEALSGLAGAALAEHQTLPDLLAQVRQVFGMREAALLERDDDGWRLVEASGESTPGADEHEIRVPAGADLALRVRGPELFAADRRVLTSYAEAAAGALITHRLAERAAEAAQLEVADRMRTTLLAGVGHDLRTPLAGIKAAVSGLRQDDVAWTATETAELLATIETGTDRLQRLVGNLLDASRLQAGAVSTALERVRLEELVGRALIDLGRLDAVALDIPEDLPDVLADVGLAERVLANVLENALRHGRAGTVTVRGALGAEPGTVVCEVIDHGPGVPAGSEATMFAPFTRLRGEAGALGDRATGGLGLGLAVARGFAEAMHGRLAAHPTPGGGLTMRLTLPLAGVPRGATTTGQGAR
ncbi:sensor histidine kinase [Geodermatophilus ruber]|uniref:histidine kinase n=1 Tax=Geodermatophilus ruber TaxID=504800 RepID=A0A1I4D368_9ACTN|nr:ATP-binding protein [Geodermatophilus ruber]SFK88028.1 Histidine kinase-, DNA gyrase B-, and HSP90-like ATPase [Geodermatophilus ruber]